MMAISFAGLSGLLFGVGLVVSHMTDPARVLGFLDFAGHWDPTLLWVMVGAIGVHLPLRRLIATKQARPRYAASFSLPPRSGIDTKLVLGAAIFGVGWGAMGYCPGPAIASATTSLTALTTLAAIVVGIALHERTLGESARPLRLPRMSKLRFRDVDG